MSQLETVYAKLVAGQKEVVITRGALEKRFRFVQPPSCTTAAQQGALVMEEVRIYHYSDDEDGDGYYLHWGFTVDGEALRVEEAKESK